jgi:hypothetical protein
VRRTLVLIGTLALLPFAASLRVHATDAAAVPTFAKDVAPILFDRCAGCHRPGEIAPMSLLSYDQVRPWARAVRNKVVAREMPPWDADPRYGKFRNDRSLSQQQIDTIVKWVDGGTPKGNDADLPPAPTFASGWQGGEPDFVFEIPFDYRVPAEGQLDILHFWVPIPFAEDRFVEALELRPGNPAVVHHARVDVATVPDDCKVVGGILLGPDGKPDVGLDRAGNRRNVFETEGNNYHLISFVPGRGYERHRAATGKRLTAGKWVRFEVHYNPSGEATTDRTRLGVWFAKTPVRHEIYTKSTGQALPNAASDESRFIVEGREIEPVVQPDGTRRRGRIPNIPAYVENWQIVGVTPVTEPITLYALSPHMHVRGKAMRWIVTWPDGRDETILDVPKYDFNWQINYELEAPLRLPAGSKLTAIGRYDNSPKNRYNPAPEKVVYWSDQSWDEMFIPYIEYTMDNRPLTATGTRDRQK